MLEQFLTDFWEPTNHPRGRNSKEMLLLIAKKAIPSSFTVSMRLFVSNRFFGQFGRFVTMFKINPSKQCLKGQKWSYSEEHHPGLECCGCRLIISVVSKRKEPGRSTLRWVLKRFWRNVGHLLIVIAFSTFPARDDVGEKIPPLIWSKMDRRSLPDAGLIAFRAIWYQSAAFHLPQFWISTRPYRNRRIRILEPARWAWLAPKAPNST